MKKFFDRSFHLDKKYSIHIIEIEKYIGYKIFLKRDCMKFKFCIIVFFVSNSFLQASEQNPLQRVNTLNGQIEHGKAEAHLFQVTSEQAKINAKVAVQVNTQKMIKEAQEITAANEYNDVLLQCDQALDGVVDKKTLRTVQFNLYKVLTDKDEDKVILNQLSLMDKEIQKKYCLMQPSARRIEAQRAALKTVVHNRLSLIAQTAPVTASAPASPVAVVHALLVQPVKK